MGKKINNYKDFIMMGVSSYDIRLLRWVETLREYYDGKVIIYLTSLDGNFSIDPDLMAKKYNIEVRCKIVDDDFWRYTKKDSKVHVDSPFCAQWKYIREIAEEYPDYAILRTDVFDAVFQDDPRKFIELTTDSNRVYISYEGMLNKDNHHMMSWLNYSIRSEEIKNIVGDTPTINSGTICTTGKNLKEISDFILKDDRIPDQHKLTIMAQCLYPNRFELSYVEGFMEALYQKYLGIKDGKIYSIGSKLCCIAHANGGDSKGILEQTYKIDKYIQSEKEIMIQKVSKDNPDFVVMGVSSYHAKLLRWVETLRENYDGKIIVYLTSLDGKYPIDPDLMAKKYNIEVRCKNVHVNFWRYMLAEDDRYNTKSPFCPQWQFIKEVADEYPNTYILRTDVFDVAFQDDPRKYVEKTNDKRVYISYEGMLNKENKYMSDWFTQSLRYNEIKDKVGNSQTINSGTICTLGKNLSEIADFIINEDQVSDQAKLSIMVQFLYPDKYELKYVEGFMEAMHQKYFGLKDNKIYSIGPKMCCIAHANGGQVKGILEEVYKMEKYEKSEKELLTKSPETKEEIDISKTIVIAPFAKKMRNNKENPKNYPYWTEVVNLLRKNGYKTLQIGVDGEPLIGADYVKFNVAFDQLENYVKNCLTWASIDSFFPHLANLFKKKGVAIFGRSDPKIYGYEQNINLLVSRENLRTRQFGLWEELEHDPNIFHVPEKVFGSIMKVIHEQ